MMDTYACVNGEIVPGTEAKIKVADRGFLYGYGLFETFLVWNGQPAFLDRHLQRLLASAKIISINMKKSKHEITGMLADTIAANRIIYGSLRLTVTAGCSDTGETGENVIVSARSGLPYSERFYREGCQAGFLSARRNEKSPLAQLKTLNYLENILGRREAVQQGWDEGLFINSAGYLAEGTVSNIFLVLDKKLLTPGESSGLLPGTVRQVAKELASGLDIECEEAFLPPGHFQFANEAFLTNSLMGIMPLVSVEGKKIGEGKPGTLTRKLMSLYQDILHKL